MRSRKASVLEKNSDIPTSAIFKDSNGISVDRDGKREEINIVNSFKKRFPDFKAIVKVKTYDCKNLQVGNVKISLLVLAKPLENNIYHAEIHQSKEKAALTSGQARALAKKK